MIVSACGAIQSKCQNRASFGRTFDLFDPTNVRCQTVIIVTGWLQANARDEEHDADSDSGAGCESSM